MEQGSRIGIIGAGPAGCCCAYFIKKLLPNVSVSLIDYGMPMRTILPTGGGRCNLAHSEFDFKELAGNYPRGEKFLYSILSKFGTGDTLNLFDELGIQTYTQDDGRIFPVSNDSAEIQQKFLHAIKGCKIIKEKALRIESGENNIKVVTDMNSYKFDKLVISTGGHSGYDMVTRLGVSIVEPRPSLVGYVTEEQFKNISGISVKNVLNHETGLCGDILFTHFGISGPLIYKISSIKARDKFPFGLSFDFGVFGDDFQQILNDNPHKYIKNILSEQIPAKLSEYVLTKLDIDVNTPSHKINGAMREAILNELHNFTARITATRKDGETVTAGGVSLDKINSKTMESKEVRNLYFCGEIIDVDGFCGGFNLQNCWSTAFVAANGVCG